MHEKIKLTINGKEFHSDDENDMKFPFKNIQNCLKISGVAQIVLSVILLVCSLLLFGTKTESLLLLLGVDVWAAGFVIIAGCFSYITKTEDSLHTNRLVAFIFNLLCIISSIAGAVANYLCIRKTLECANNRTLQKKCEHYGLLPVLLVSSVIILVMATLFSTISSVSHGIILMKKKKNIDTMSKMKGKENGRSESVEEEADSVLISKTENEEYE